MFPRHLLCNNIGQRVCVSPFVQVLQRRFAGHSKWSKIKRSKGAKDVNRAKEFSKATRAIRAASKACGGDMGNLHLQSSIQAARAIQVPKDRIEDAINCATKESTEDIESMRYDGHLSTPSGKVAIILQALTDNKNRTAANVRATLKRSRGELLNTGANDWLFDHVGVVLTHKVKGHVNEDGESTLGNFSGMNEEEEDELLECALEGGATDVDFGETEDEHALVMCEPSDLHPLVLSLREGDYNVTEFETRYMVKDPSSNVDLDTESTDKFQKFLDKMDEDEDVSQVYFNANLC